MINGQQKNEIKWKLQNYVSSFPSQRQAAISLKNCSEATVIGILTDKWGPISEEMWRNVANQLTGSTTKLQMVETFNFQTLILYFILAKENGATFSLVGGAGYGKSYCGKWYSQVNREKNVIYLECAEYWNKKMFLTNLLAAMGKSGNGLNVGEMMETIVAELRRRHQPVIILDEVDKLADPVFKFFITLYNELNGACGFVWLSTDNIEKRITKGLRNNRNGYQELFSRIGQRFISLPCASAQDIKAICQTNGIASDEEINTIINECSGDLRRVERNILKNRFKQLKTKLKSVA